MNVELADLRTFVAAAACGSLSGAARDLRVTQPSISERLARLERIVGRPLLTRSSRGVSLTPAGQRFLPHAERCLALAGRAVEVARIEDTQASLHVTAYASYAPIAIPFVVEQLRSSHYSITVDDQHSTEALRRVAAGSTDLAFTLPVPHAHEVRLHRFRRDPVVAVAHPGHPLAGTRCALRRLAGQHLAYSAWGSGIDAFLERLQDLPSRGHQLLQVGPAETAAELARTGLAIALVTHSTVERDLRHGVLAPITVTDLPAWHVDIMVAHHRDRAHEPPIAAVLSAVAAGK